MLRKILAAICAALLFTAAVPQVRAGSLTTSVIGMFPKDVGEFVYADLKTARHYPWFAQFKDQVVPSRFRQFEKFLAAAGTEKWSVLEGRSVSISSAPNFPRRTGFSRRDPVILLLQPSVKSP